MCDGYCHTDLETPNGVFFLFINDFALAKSNPCGNITTINLQDPHRILCIHFDYVCNQIKVYVPQSAME